MSSFPPILLASDSTEQGFLAPSNTYDALEDQTLQRYLQQMVTGISGLPGNRVFTRFRPEPPNEPADVTDNWAAIGPVRRDPDTFAFEGFLPDNNYGVIRHELIDLVASFYGAGAEANAERFSLGLQLSQNREYFTRSGYGLVEAGVPTPLVPVKRNELTIYGVDVHLTIRRRQQMGYQVNTVAEFEGDLVVDQPSAVYPLVAKES